MSKLNQAGVLIEETKYLLSILEEYEKKYTIKGGPRKKRMKKTPLKRGNVKLKRTVLIKKGRISEINAIARNKIAQIAEEKGIDHCELGLDGCQEYYTLAPAHRNRREWYRGDVEKLSDYNQWICACSNCHQIIDDDDNLKEEKFNQLRP